jgi:iron complex transport system ATP-binding protein
MGGPAPAREDDQGPQPLLQARGIGVRLGGHWVVRDVDLAVHAGEIVAVAGPNGAGKTTLLKTLAGVLEPDEGEVRIGERPLAGCPRRELARRLAYLPQETWTEFGVRVAEVVRLGRFPHAGALRPLGGADRAAVADAMRDADVAHLAERTLPSLSGGERRRVHLARAIAQQAALLVLDEPTSALDVGHACAVLDLLVRIAASQRAVVFSLHDLTLAVRGPTRVLLLDEGRPVAEGAPAAVLTGQEAERAFGVRLVRVDDPPAIVPQSQAGSSS